MHFIDENTRDDMQHGGDYNVRKWNEMLHNCE